MRKLICLLSTVLIVACSSPKYTASFNYYDKNSASSAKSVAELEEPPTAVAQSEQLLASTSSAPVELETPKAEVRKTYLQMTKPERKALRVHLKREIKSYVKEQKKNFNVESTQASSMDEDLKLASIFGAVGIVALIISGNVFYVIGAIALIIGVVFFVKWLIRQ